MAADIKHQLRTRCGFQRQRGDAASGHGFGMIEHPCRLPDHVARRFQTDRDIGKLELYRLIVEDVARIGTGSFGELHRHFTGRVANPQRIGG